MYNDISNPPVFHCSFIDNAAAGSGGGMLNHHSDPLIAYCAFTANSSDDAYGGGGGMYNVNSFPIVDGCTFEENAATADGGGMHNRYAAPEVKDCVFTNNTAGDDDLWRLGGGIYNYYYSDATITNNEVCGNLPDQITGPYTDGGSNYISTECHLGACCIEDDCVVESQVDCILSGGMYMGEGTTCADTDCPSPCPGDIAGPDGGPDGTVDVHDLLVLLSQWDSAGPEGDITGPDGIPDGTVDVHDLLTILGTWGECDYYPSKDTKIVWRSERSGTSSIWAMDSDGSNKIQLTDDLGNDSTPSISPDGTEIAFASDRNGTPYRLFIMNSDGTDMQEIAAVADLNVQFSSWNQQGPDGPQVLFGAVSGCCDGGLFRVDMDGTNLEQLTVGYDSRPFLLADGETLFFDRRTSSLSHSHQLHRLPPVGFIQQCTFGYPSETTTTTFGGFSLDGSKIVYSRGHSIWIANSNCPISGETLLFEGSYPTNVWETPSWSPDGKWLVFSHTPPGGDSNIYISRTDGTALRQLTFDSGADEVERWGVGKAPRSRLAAPE